MAECRKHGYPSRKAAATARNHRMAKGRNRPDCLRIYACADCGLWHMAHGKITERDWLKTLGPKRTRTRKWSAKDQQPDE